MIEKPRTPPQRATLAAGETAGLVGESGCSKSTLVRLLTLDCTDGQLRFHGKSIGLITARAMAVHPLTRNPDGVPGPDRQPQPAHSYTRALIASLPGRLAHGEAGDADLLLGGAPASPINPEPKRCRLQGRWPRASALCGQQVPGRQLLAQACAGACHFPAGLS